MMYTNGLNYWTKIIKNSQANPPYNVSDVVLSSNNKKLVVYYSPSSNESMVQLKTFKMNKEQEFEYFIDPILNT